MKTEIEKYHPCEEALKFRKKYDSFEKAWKECPRGDWMLWIASRLKINHRTLTFAKAKCARTIYHLMTDKRSKKAVIVAESYGKGIASKSDLNAADDAAYAAYAAAAAADAADADAAAYAADAAAAAAADDAAYAAAAAAYAAAAAAYAAADAAAAAYAADAARKRNQKATARICRKYLTEEVFKKLGL